MYRSSSWASDLDGFLLMSAVHLALRLQSVEHATKDALGKEYDEKHQQHAVDEVVPADRLGAEADTKGLRQQNGDDGADGRTERDEEAANDRGEHHLERH